MPLCGESNTSGTPGGAGGVTTTHAAVVSFGISSKSGTTGPDASLRHSAAPSETGGGVGAARVGVAGQRAIRPEFDRVDAAKNLAGAGGLS